MIVKRPASLSTAYCGFEQPCPFLKENLCQIYPYRPLACRMHFSLTPPHWCRPSHFQNPHALRLNLEPGKCVFDALEKLEDRFQLDFSDVMVCGLLELTVNVMQFERFAGFDAECSVMSNGVKATRPPFAKGEAIRKYLLL